MTRWCTGYEHRLTMGDSGVPKTWICKCTARGWGWPKPHWQATTDISSYFTQLVVNQCVQAYRDAGADV